MVPVEAQVVPEWGTPPHPPSSPQPRILPLQHMDIYIASQVGNLPCLRALLNGGAPIDAKNSTGTVTALIMASMHGQEAAVGELLARGAGVNVAGETGMTPLYIAAYEGHQAVVTALLKAGAGVNLLFMGSSPLQAASLCKCVGRAAIWRPPLSSFTRPPSPRPPLPPINAATGRLWRLCLHMALQ